MQLQRSKPFGIWPIWGLTFQQILCPFEQIDGVTRITIRGQDKRHAFVVTGAKTDTRK